jgi:hypothetical protein
MKKFVSLSVNPPARAETRANTGETAMNNYPPQHEILGWTEHYGLAVYNGEPLFAVEDLTVDDLFCQHSYNEIYAGQLRVLYCHAAEQARQEMSSPIHTRCDCCMLHNLNDMYDY